VANKDKKSVTETQVHQAISGIPYPTTKDELIKYASAKSAGGGVVDVLESLPPAEYQNEPQVLTTIREYKG
jgi:hypothetical protein